MTEAMPFLQKYDITFLRPPTIRHRVVFSLSKNPSFRFCLLRSLYTYTALRAMRSACTSFSAIRRRL